MPTPTDFGMRAFNAFQLIPDTFSTKASLWRNTEGLGTTIANQELAGTSDLVLKGPNASTVFSSTNRLFGDASLDWRPASIDAYGEIDDSTTVSLNGTNDFAWLGWIFPRTAGEGSAGRIWHDQGQFRIRTTASGALIFELNLGAGFVTITTTNFLNYGAPEWWFVAISWVSPTANIYRARVTDVLTTTDTTSGAWVGTVANSASSIIVGDDSSAGGNMFDGLLAEVQFVADRQLTKSAIDAAFALPWFYFAQRPLAPWGDGLRDSVLRSRTADGDEPAIQIAMSLPELSRRWSAMNDADRAGFRTYFRDVLHDGRDLFFLLDTLDFDAETERLVRLVQNPFNGFVPRRQNRSPLELLMLQLTNQM